MRRHITVRTVEREALYDITEAVKASLADSGIRDGICSLYVRGATASLMIQENWDDSVPRDVVRMMAQIAPRGVWEHDKQDGNGDSHLKAGLVGPSETIPFIDGELGLSRWQNIFLCEFDGPRERREIVVTLIGDTNG
ncbi:MAG: secondary thiamine-phosphate synthase enzyme YjbQ [Spirochaetaceae bacterium]|nr:secondary thiamine-phosphate synthase enzyme YjbQ [Spirochaetaceae bacterium]